MKNSNMLIKLKPVIKEALSGTVLEPAHIEETAHGKLIIRYRVYDDDLLGATMFQPIIVNLHEDFFTSSFAENPFPEIRREFSEFIRHKAQEFEPRSTRDSRKAQTPEYWIFPEEC